MIYLMTICCNYTHFTGLSWHFMGFSQELRLAYSSSWFVDWCLKFSQIVLTSLERTICSSGQEGQNYQIQEAWSFKEALCQNSSGSLQDPSPQLYSLGPERRLARLMPFGAPFYCFQPSDYQKGAWTDLLFLLTLRERMILSVLFFASK